MDPRANNRTRIGVALAVASLLAGCGGNDDGDAANSGGTPGARSAEAASGGPGECPLTTAEVAEASRIPVVGDPRVGGESHVAELLAGQLDHTDGASGCTWYTQDLLANVDVITGLPAAAFGDVQKLSRGWAGVERPDLGDEALAFSSFADIVVVRSDDTTIWVMTSDEGGGDPVAVAGRVLEELD